MKMRKCFGLMLAFALVVSSLGASTLAAEPQADADPDPAIERASGWFNETVSAEKVKKIGSAISLRVGEVVRFEVNYSPKDATVDFGIVDANNVFYYITSTTGSINGEVEAPENGSYTPAIRNNSSGSISVAGIIGAYVE